MLLNVIFALLLTFSWWWPQLSAAQTDPRATTGEWAQPTQWPYIPIHLALLQDGKVIGWGRQGHQAAPIYIWDPQTNQFTTVPNPQNVNLFCSGHAFLWDGRLLIAGGHIIDGNGLPNTTIFNPVTKSLSE